MVVSIVMVCKGVSVLFLHGSADNQFEELALEDGLSWLLAQLLTNAGNLVDFFLCERLLHHSLRHHLRDKLAKIFVDLLWSVVHRPGERGRISRVDAGVL